jgi:hypothetical protein
VWAVWAVGEESGISAVVDPTTALTSAVWTFLGLVIVTLGGVVVELIRTRGSRLVSQPAIPAGFDASLLMTLAKEQGQLVQRAEDCEEAIEEIDRGREHDRKDLDAILRFLDCEHPNWRRR